PTMQPHLHIFSHKVRPKTKKRTKEPAQLGFCRWEAQAHRHWARACKLAGAARVTFVAEPERRPDPSQRERSALPSATTELHDPRCSPATHTRRRTRAYPLIRGRPRCIAP